MKIIISIIALFMTLIGHARADRFHSRIHEIEFEKNQTKDVLVKFENGRVAFVNPGDLATVSALREGQKDGVLLALEVSENQDLISVQTLQRQQLPRDEETGIEEVPMSYEPTVLPNLSRARSVFSRMKRGWQNDSQCYNRAHVWAYEEHKRSALNSVKLFLFFTSRYIRNYRYKWWFHVSPMVHVSENRNIVWRVLDRRYTRGPLRVKTWTDIFIRSKRSCPVVSKYSDYENNQYKEDCYLIPVTQYYWQPRDIDRFERTGQEKTSFIKSELDWAYWEAF